MKVDWAMKNLRGGAAFERRRTSGETHPREAHGGHHELLLGLNTRGVLDAEHSEPRACWGRRERRRRVPASALGWLYSRVGILKLQ